MMNARLGWLLIGCVIGFILGYVVRSLRELREKVDEVDSHITNREPRDDGFITPEWAKNIALLVVVLLVAYSAFASQKASNDVKKEQDHNAHLVACNQQYLIETIAALNSRTAYTQIQNNANVDLQKAFNKVVTASLVTPPLSEADARHVVEDYAAALNHFLEISAKSANQVKQNPFPTSTAFADCLKKK